MEGEIVLVACTVDGEVARCSGRRWIYKKLLQAVFNGERPDGAGSAENALTATKLAAKLENSLTAKLENFLTLSEENFLTLSEAETVVGWDGGQGTSA